VHCQDGGHPVVGDKKYGAKSNPIGRVGLHAWVLGFEHPITNEYLRFETPIPPKFLSVFA
jgi:23S rRNA pseudouridine1911/1915/1917 synthase